MAKKKRNIKNWLKESMFILIPAALVFGTFTVVIKPAERFCYFFRKRARECERFFEKWNF